MSQQECLWEMVFDTNTSYRDQMHESSELTTNTAGDGVRVSHLGLVGIAGNTAPKLHEVGQARWAAAHQRARDTNAVGKGVQLQQRCRKKKMMKIHNSRVTERDKREGAGDEHSKERKPKRMKDNPFNTMTK